ncbi:MAG: protein-L-isoaspartate O-methyltransferase [Comamonas sp.]|jgi:protein-L-isoaspartate(D-aspartate) O-methyltransferase|uniref:protein-L-isoaspartate O-methyltransferase family protein n=1 Tax=Comamonas sp. TaxID=34028 RepID=UPI0028216BA3|nr:protein-L-isoaspartate O-methyltransferase [Comamonas sp.]MDR0216925.1 protein-L-isoaspartate O-methyltransferase [Comamonas sp.]MDR2299369.1 protein-L-isoaspartate O-methyltransferase [Comamonas sp.]
MALPMNAQVDPRDVHAQARFNMIEQQVRPWNVLDESVLELMGQIHREDFVPPEYQSMAYMDLEIPLKGTAEEAAKQGWHMLAPKIEARMLQDVQLKPSDRVLEIGSGSGYMAALLAAQAKEVVTMEIDPELAEMARENLLSAGIKNVEVKLANGATASLAQGTFDVIVLSGSVAEIPEALYAQLNEGGRIAAIVGHMPVMRFTLVTRNGDNFEVKKPWDIAATRLVGFEEPSRFSF